MRRYLELDCMPGAKAQIAREFKVARSTIARDIRQWSGDQVRLCPTCFGGLSTTTGTGSSKFSMPRPQYRQNRPLEGHARAPGRAVYPVGIGVGRRERSEKLGW